MFLTIVIPTYNRAHLIENTLMHVLNQTCDDFEVIIVDDGSKDNTAQVVQPFLSERVRYVSIPNSERAAARNKGTQLARGQYVNWFDSDDEMLPHHVAYLRDLVQQNNFPDVACVMYQIKDAITHEITSVKSDYSTNTFRRKHYLIEGNFLACNPVILNRDFALENPFNEDKNLSASEDYELWLRLLPKTKFVIDNEVTSYLVQHDERSVTTMVDAEKLETRFLTFLHYIRINKEFRNYLGKDWGYFEMRNYLLLSVDLALNKHRKKALKYLFLALKSSKSALTQRLFWATVKHILL